MYDLLITNASVVTMDRRHRILSPGFVAVRGKTIAAVGPMEELTRDERHIVHGHAAAGVMSLEGGNARVDAVGLGGDVAGRAAGADRRPRPRRPLPDPHPRGAVHPLDLDGKRNL